jgi:hypothetical protein
VLLQDNMPDQVEEVRIENAPSAQARSRTDAQLRVVPSAQTHCSTEKQDEIVVCAINPETFRLRPLDDKFTQEPAKAVLHLSDSTSASAEVEGSGVGGWPSNRVMVRLKFKF